VTAIGGKDAVIAYVEKASADSRVKVTRVDDKGARRGDATIPAGKGDASDVSLVALDDGFVLAWVDTRDGNGEVYAAKLRNDLSIATSTRITNAPGSTAIYGA